MPSYRTTATALTLLACLAAAPAHAVKPGLYIGASAGGASTEYDSGGVDFDKSDTAWKIFAGYHFLQFFAVEATYRDLGSPSGDVSGTPAKLESTAYDVAGLVGMPIGPVYLFGKLGLAQWDSDFTLGGTKDSDDGSGYVAGIGGSIDLIKIQLRAEVEYIDADKGAPMYSVGAAWRF